MRALSPLTMPRSQPARPRSKNPLPNTCRTETQNRATSCLRAIETSADTACVWRKARAKNGGETACRLPPVPVRKVTVTLGVTRAADQKLGQDLPEAVHPRGHD